MKTDTIFKLKPVLDSHELWVQSNIREGEQANLSSFQSDKTDILEPCQCHTCVQFGLSFHSVETDDLERTAYTTKYYESTPIKPRYSNYIVYQAAKTLKVSI